MFADQIGKSIEVYVDDMLVKSIRADQHIADLDVAFTILRSHEMKLNPAKYMFGVSSGKFLGYIWGKLSSYQNLRSGISCPYISLSPHRPLARYYDQHVREYNFRPGDLVPRIAPLVLWGLIGKDLTNSLTLPNQAHISSPN
ncbi:unnamed protein product [Prunus armeniaca]